MTLILHILILSAIIWIFYRNASKSPINKHYFPAIILKLTAGIVLGVIYFNYYKSGDTLVFHETAMGILKSKSLPDNEYVNFVLRGPDEVLKKLFPILNESRSAYFMKIILILYKFTAGNYWLTSIYLSLLSFAGSWKLTNSIIRYNPAIKWPALVGLLYLPAFVFWTSGVLKESVAWFCIAIPTSFFLDYVKNRQISIWRIIASVFIIYVLWMIKYYYAAVLVLFLGPLWLYYFLRIKFEIALSYVVVLLGSGILIVVILTFLHPNFNPTRIFSLISENHLIMLERSLAGHAIGFFKLDRPNLDFLINIPVSLFGGLFMPLIWQGTGIFVKATGMINTLSFFLFIGKLADLIKTGKRSFQPEEISLSLYIIFLAILLAYTSPNFGTLERYKTSYIAFFTMWVFYKNPLIEGILSYFKH